jgi:hypothetical protein
MVQLTKRASKFAAKKFYCIGSSATPLFNQFAGNSFIELEKVLKCKFSVGVEMGSNQP